MKDINDKLDNISGLITEIDTTVKSINQRLEELIKALHDYDDEDYGESSFEAFQEIQGGPCSKHDEPLHGPCSKHDAEQWDEERMNIIGQNGNEGTHYDSHYVTNEEADEDAEFSDYGMRIAKEVMNDKDNVRVDKDKSNNIQPKQKRYYKNNRSKRNDNKK